MATEYSIQKMVSDGTLSTITLGIQYLQRNDIYIRIAGEETPQSGAPSGYTWSFIDNTTLKILPVVPNGVEVYVYRRTDIGAMYNIYSQNAQFDEATIDENNQQLLYIAQEYLEQGIPGAGVDSVEFVREVGLDVYYRLKLTDGSYTPEFIISRTTFEDIAGVDGAGYVGRATIPQIRAYTGDKSYILCSGVSTSDRTHSGAFFYDSTDTISPDNGGSVLVDVTGRRWKRDYQKNSTGMFWEEYGALIHRVGDRLLVGDAIKNGKNVVNQPDWLTQYQLSTGRSFGATQTAQVCVQSGVGSNDRGSNAFVAAGQTKHLGDNYNSVGVFGISVANRPTGRGHAYAGYFEGFRSAAALGGAYGVEIDTVTYSACGPTDPYQQADNQVVGLQLAAGAELSPTGQFPNNAAVNVRNNGSTYRRGIIIGADALTDCDGVVGSAVAMEMAKGHGIVWYSGPGKSTSSIYGLATDPAKSNGIVFGDNALAFVQSIDGKKIFDVEHSVSGPGVNYPAVRGSGAGLPIQILARGEDANIDINLVPKGAAFVRFGQWTGQGDQAINGFIAIKDAAGNIRKIPTIA